MNISEEALTEWCYIQNFNRTEMVLQRTFGASETLISCDTCQFEDYSKYVADRFDPGKKAARHREIFPLECQKAFEMRRGS